MNFDEILKKNRSYKDDDGFMIEYKFNYWAQFRYNQIRWNSKDDFVIIEFPFVHEEKEQIIGEGVIQKYLSPNRDIVIPTSSQKEALLFFLSNEASLGQRVVNNIFDEYNRQRSIYKEPDDSSYMPKLQNGNELVTYLELTRVYVLPNSYGNTSFVGLYFGGCSWDEEHGLGVLTWKERVVKIGHIEDASDLRFSL